jgi:hypothetical protein
LDGPLELHNKKRDSNMSTSVLSVIIFFSEANGSIGTNRMGGVMVSVLASSVVLDRGFGPRSGQTKDYKIGVCGFPAKHAALRRKRKDWLARNLNNVSEWSDMSIRRLLFQ